MWPNKLDVQEIPEGYIGEYKYILKRYLNDTQKNTKGAQEMWVKTRRFS